MADAGIATRERTNTIHVSGVQRTSITRMVKRWNLQERLDAACEKEPLLRGIYERLAVYLPEPIITTYERKPLFVACAQDGLAAMAAARTRPLEAFLLGVLQKAPIVLRYDLVGKAGRWDPIADAPLAVWLSEHGAGPRPRVAPPWPPVSINRFANALYDRLVDPQEMERPSSIRGYAGP